MPVVVGFLNEYLLKRHFHDHGHEFGAQTKEAYLAMAKTFLELDLTANPHILECKQRKNGDVIRFNPRTDEFAIITSTGRIKTYFKPVPSRLAPFGTPLYLTHTFQNNMSYFRYKCRQ